MQLRSCTCRCNSDVNRSFGAGLTQQGYAQYSTADGSQVCTRQGNHASPVCCTVSPDGAMLLVGTEHACRLYKMADLRELRVLEGSFGVRTRRACAFSPDSQLIAVARDARVVLYDAANGLR